MGLFNLSLDCECCISIVPALITPQAYYHAAGSKSVSILPNIDGVYFHFGTLAGQINNLIPQINTWWNFVKDEMWANINDPPASPTIPSGWRFGANEQLIISAWRNFVSDIGIVFFSSPSNYKTEHMVLIGTAGRIGHAAMDFALSGSDYALSINARLQSQVWGVAISCPQGKSLLESTEIAKVVIEYKTNRNMLDATLPPWNQYVDKLALTVADPNAPSPFNIVNTFKSGNTKSLTMAGISLGYGSLLKLQGTGFNVVGIDGSMIDRLVDGDVIEETTLAPDSANTSHVLTIDDTSGFLNFASSNGDPYIFLAFYPTPLYWDSNPIPGPPIIDFAWGQWLHGCNFVCVTKVTFYDADDNVFIMSDFNPAIFTPPGQGFA